MKILSFLAAIAVMALLSWGVLAAHHTVPEQIEARIVAFETAWAAGDAAAIGALYTADGLTYPPGGAVTGGAEAIGAAALNEIEAGNVRIDLMTDELEAHGDTAIEAGRYDLFDKDGAKTSSGKYIVIWKRTEAGWRLHRDIWNAGY